MADRSNPITTPSDGYELCYECDGKRLCWSCKGEGRRKNGERCGNCVGRGRCIVCNGDGELPAGTKASLDGRTPAPGGRVAKRVGCFRELGYESGPSLEQSRGNRPSANQEKVVAYLRAGKILVMSPGYLRDPFDRSVPAGTHSMRTDGAFAWPDSLAYFVERHAVALPLDFEQHMAALDWRIPPEIQIKGLEIENE